MRWIALIVLAWGLATAGVCYLQAKKVRADQGYVKSDDGQEWRLTRMQSIGIGEEMVAVYESVK